MHGRLWIMCCMFGTLAGIAQAESQADHRTVDQGWLVKIVLRASGCLCPSNGKKSKPSAVLG